MSYNFPAGPITMADIVRYANEHGMYFSPAAAPQMSSVRKAVGVMSYGAPTLTCEALISGTSDVHQWRDNAKTINYVLVMTVSGVLVPGAIDLDPRNVDLFLEHGVDWGGGLWSKGSHAHSATQNDPTDNLRRNIHALYALSACGSRLSTDSTPFVGRATFNMAGFDLDLSYLNIELSLFDLVDDTAGLL